MHRNNRVFIWGVLAGLAFQGFHANAQIVRDTAAQGLGSKGLPAVVVTAQKREELLQQVPVPVTAITAGQVQAYRIWENRDIRGIVPNLYAADPGDGRDVISIRGITTTSYDPAVAVCIDGVSQFSLDTYIPALFDIERIEVLRGPQGTLYGRNAMGGVINIITRQPSGRTEGFAEVSMGNYDRLRSVAGFRTPLVKDRLYAGIAGMYDGRNGYYTNLYDGKSYDKQHAYTGNYFLKYIPGARWELELNLKQRLARNNGPFPLVMGARSAFSHPFVLKQNATTTMVDNTVDASLVANHRGDRLHITAQTAYQDNYRYYTNPIDGDFSPLDAVSIINNYGRDWNRVRVLTQELKFVSPPQSSSAWKWTGGAYFFYEDVPKKLATRYGKDARRIGAGDSLFTTLNTTRSHRWGAALYGQAVYALTSRFNFTAGLRYDYERQEEHVQGAYQHDPDPSWTIVRPDTSGHTSFGALSPKLGLDYRLSAYAMAYLSYSRGFRTGGLTQLSSDPSQPPLVGFEPEYSDNYELGVKSSFFGNLLRANLSLFDCHISNVQTPTLILPDAITVVRNAGSLNARGAELELSALPVEGLSADYHFGYTYSRFEKLKLSTNGTVKDFAGNRQLFTPDVTSMLALQYVRPFGRHRQWRAIARGEWRYTGTTYFDLANSIRQSPYSLYNVRCGIGFRNTELLGWGRNIGDVRYIAYAYDFGAVHLGDPGTYGVTLATRLN